MFHLGGVSRKHWRQQKDRSKGRKLMKGELLCGSSLWVPGGFGNLLRSYFRVAPISMISVKLLDFLVTNSLQSLFETTWEQTRQQASPTCLAFPALGLMRQTEKKIKSCRCLLMKACLWPACSNIQFQKRPTSPLLVLPNADFKYFIFSSL